MNQKGFTLLELIIVFIIIVTLACFAIPKLVELKEKQRTIYEQQKAEEAKHTKKEVVKRHSDSTIEAEHFEYDGHHYIIFNKKHNTNRIAVVHNPKCTCFENETNSKPDISDIPNIVDNQNNSMYAYPPSIPN